MGRSWPSGLAAYRRTSEFDAESLPAGLRHEHSTKMGVWGRVHVLEGALQFRRLDPYEELELTIGTHDVIGLANYTR